MINKVEFFKKWLKYLFAASLILLTFNVLLVLKKFFEGFLELRHMIFELSLVVLTVVVIGLVYFIYISIKENPSIEVEIQRAKEKTLEKKRKKSAKK